MSSSILFDLLAVEVTRKLAQDSTGFSGHTSSSVLRMVMHIAKHILHRIAAGLCNLLWDLFRDRCEYLLSDGLDEAGHSLAWSQVLLPSKDFSLDIFDLESCNCGLEV